MARWKDRVDFLLSVIELLVLTVEPLQGKTCQNSLLSGGWVSLSQDFRGKGSSLGNIFLVFKKDTFCYLIVQTAPCTCSHFDTISACYRRKDGQTDRQTDGRAIASTAIAMRAIARCKKYSQLVTTPSDIGCTGL